MALVQVLESQSSPYRIVGFLDDDPTKAAASPPVLGPTSRLIEIASQGGVKTAILATTHEVNSKLLGILQVPFFISKLGLERRGVCSRPTNFAPWSMRPRKREPYGLRKMTHVSAALGAFYARHI